MAAAPAHIHIESVQTAVPTRVAADRGRLLPIAVHGPALTAAELQRRFLAVLYYRGTEGVHGQQLDEGEARARLEQAVWVTEALSAALPDHPKMAGRLRRGSDDAPSWGVKLSDAGLRFLVASADTTMSAFLAEEAKGARESNESALALWTDVDPLDPEMCAPFVMQFTRFQDGGYAIGACCSLLHADPLSLADFLKSWARTHAQLQAQSELVINQVIRYTRYFRSPAAAAKRLKSVPLVPPSAESTTKTVLFRTAAGGDAPAADDRRQALAEACIAQASEKLGVEKPARFTVLAADGSGGLNVHACTGQTRKTAASPGYALRDACWHEAGLEEVVLDGSKPVHVSCSIVSPCADEGLVVVMPAAAGGTELLISATVPSW